MHSKMLPILAIFLLGVLTSCGSFGSVVMPIHVRTLVPVSEPKLLNATCSIDAQCKLPNTSCRSNMCQCALGFLEYHKTLCRQAYCQRDSECIHLFGQFTTCGQFGKCACAEGSKLDHDTQKCLPSTSVVPVKIVRPQKPPTINNCKFGHLPGKSGSESCAEMRCVDDFDCNFIFGANTTCDKYLHTCKCDQMHSLNETSKTCSIAVPKKNHLNDSCSFDAECGVKHSICQQGKCHCPVGFETRGNTCRFYFCSTNDQCRSRIGSNTKCSWGSNQCVCDDSYNLDPYTRTCVTTTKALNASCYSSDECGRSADCVNYQCKCQLGYTQDGLSPVNCRQMQCYSDYQCNAQFNNTKCSGGSCSCSWSSGFKIDTDTQSCVPKSKRIGDSCFYDSQCGYNANCMNGQCKCFGNYAAKSNQMDCQSAPCTYNSDCELSDWNSMCSFGTCSCKDGYEMDYFLQQCTATLSYDYYYTTSVSLFAIVSLLCISLGVLIITLRHRRIAAAQRPTTTAYVQSSAKVSLPQKS